jgi:uncharacterized protein
VAEGWRQIAVMLRNQDVEAYVNVPYSGDEGQVQDILTVDDVRKALKAKGISTGIMVDEVERIFRESLFDEEVLVAQGTLPKHGKHGKIEFYFKTSKEFQPKEDEDGRIDYRDVSFLENVKKGDHLCKISPPTPGFPGKALTGREIGAKDGHDVVMPQGQNTELSDAGGPELLVAASDGCVTLNKGKQVEVLPKLEIKGDVDFNTGNINFNGALVIGGDVKAGFLVETTGDLEIGGSVEDAEVRVKGNALIKKGFVGNGKGLVTTTGNLTIKFAQNQKIKCDGNLILGGEIMHCESRVGGDLTASGRKGAIIGGIAMVQGNIEVPQLGSVNFTKTTVQVGYDFKMEERKREIDEELEKLAENEEKIKKALYNLSRLKLKMQGNLSEEHQKLFERLQDTVKSYPKYREKLSAELNGVDQKIGDHLNAHVKITGTLYPGVKVVIGKFTKVFNDKMGHTTLREAKGQIVGSA